MRVGEENKGWNLIVSQLNHERLTLGPAGNIGHRYDRLVRWARTTMGQGGKPLIDEPEVRRAIAQVYAWLRTNELLNWQVAAGMDTGWLGAPDPSATKGYGSAPLPASGPLLGRAVAPYTPPPRAPRP